MLGDDGQLAGGDAEVVLRLGDPESEGVGRGALALPSEGSLRLGGEEGRGESGVGLLPAESGASAGAIPRPDHAGADAVGAWRISGKAASAGKGCLPAAMVARWAAAAA